MNYSCLYLSRYGRINFVVKLQRFVPEKDKSPQSGYCHRLAVNKSHKQAIATDTFRNTWATINTDVHCNASMASTRSFQCSSCMARTEHCHVPYSIQAEDIQSHATTHLSPEGPHCQCGPPWLRCGSRPNHHHHITIIGHISLNICLQCNLIQTIQLDILQLGTSTCKMSSPVLPVTCNLAQAHACTSHMLHTSKNEVQCRMHVDMLSSCCGLNFSRLLLCQTVLIFIIYLNNYAEVQLRYSSRHIGSKTVIVTCVCVCVCKLREEFSISNARS